MAQLFPKKQTWVDEKIDDIQVIITRVVLVSTGTDHVFLPTAAWASASLA